MQEAISGSGIEVAASGRFAALRRGAPEIDSDIELDSIGDIEALERGFSFGDDEAACAEPVAPRDAQLDDDDDIERPSRLERRRRRRKARPAPEADAPTSSRPPRSVVVLDDVDGLDEELDDVYVPRRIRRRGLGKVVGALIATLVVVGLLLVHVWSRYKVLKLGYTLSELSSEREDLLEENRRLRIEMRILTRADRLEPLARRQLGLVKPRHEQIVYVPVDTLPMPTFPELDAPVDAPEEDLAP